MQTIFSLSFEMKIQYRGKHRILHGILWLLYVFTMRPYLHLYLVYLYISNTARLQCSPNRGGVLCHFALRGLLHAAATLL